jgi:hypothetical protein
MAFVPAANTALVQHVGVLDEQEIINTLHIRATGGWNGTTLAALAVTQAAWYTAHVVTLMGPLYTYAHTTCTDQAVDGGAQAIDNSLAGATGGFSGNTLPNNCAFCVSFRTARTGRSNRGRNYVPALPEQQVARPNHMSLTYVSAIVAAYQQLLIPSTAGGEWVVVSRQHNKVVLSVANVEPITSVLAVDDTIDSQRRRLPGRGR